MKKLFIESSEFTRWLPSFLGDEAYAALQSFLMEHPDRGTVLPGCGGLRKLRLADPKRRKGKRGGARIIYLHVPEANWIFLVDIYGKGEKEDLSAAERKVLKQLAEEFKVQARRATAKGREEREA
jgi:hypothetical protein